MGLRPLARRVIAALLLVLLTACHSWRPTTVSPQQLIPEEQPSLVRVTLIDGETVTVRDPTMRNDSIVGVTDAVGALTRRGVGVASRALLLVLLTACHSWRPTTVSPQQLMFANETGRRGGLACSRCGVSVPLGP